MDEVGHVVVRMDMDDYPELKPMLERYAKGNYEPVRSSFNLSFNSIVNLLEKHDPERIRQIVNQSFLAWHANRGAEDAGEETEPSRSRSRAEARRRRNRNRTWEEFQVKVTFLKSVGYLDEDGAFNAGAKILRHLQISEVFVTELVLAGLLEDLSPSRLFGVLCGLTNTLPRHVHANFRLRGEDRPLARQIAEIRESQLVLDAESLSGAEVNWDPEVMHLGRGWAEGVPLLELMTWLHSDTDVSGDLVTGFRRAKDLVGQLRDVYAEIPDRVAMLSELLRTVSRDEVEVVG
jgi:superfamily II RNA helicase